MASTAAEPPAEAFRHPVWAALGLMLGPAVSLGLARFAYALILPSMRTALHWSFSTAGALNSANALGYLVGALLASRVATSMGERRAFLGGLAVTGVALAASALSGNVALLLALRLIAGIAGAVCLVVGGGLAAQIGRDSSRRRATLVLTLYFVGGGVGILVSGLVVPAVLAGGGWRLAWLVLGGIALAALVAAIPAACSVPETRAALTRVHRDRVPMSRLAALLTSYGLFGAGYIAYMTFIVAYLKSVGAVGHEITLFWSVLGVAAVAGGFLWRPVLSVLPGGVSTALVLIVVTVGALLPVVSAGMMTSYLSALLFGSAFLTVITAVTTTARDNLPEQQWTSAIAVLTSAFALGQCVGPVLSGMLSDGPGGMRRGLITGVVLLVLAVVAAVFQRTSRDSVGDTASMRATVR